MKANETGLKEKIMAEEKHNKSLKDKRAEIDEKIKKSDEELKRLRMMEDSEQLNKIKDLAGQSGYSLEDVLSMLQNQNNQTDSISERRDY